MHRDVASLEADSSIRKLHLTKLGKGKVTLTLQDGSTTEIELNWYECTESANSIVDLYKAVTEQGEFFNAIVVSGLGYYDPDGKDDQPYLNTSYGAITNSFNLVTTDENNFALMKKGTVLFVAYGTYFNGEFKNLQLPNTLSFGPILQFDSTIIIPMDADYHPYNGTAKWKDLEVIAEKIDRTIYFL